MAAGAGQRLDDYHFLRNTYETVRLSVLLDEHLSALSIRLAVKRFNWIEFCACSMKMKSPWIGELTRHRSVGRVRDLSTTSSELVTRLSCREVLPINVYVNGNEGIWKDKPRPLLRRRLVSRYFERRGHDRTRKRILERRRLPLVYAPSPNMMRHLPRQKPNVNRRLPRRSWRE